MFFVTPLIKCNFSPKHRGRSICLPAATSAFVSDEMRGDYGPDQEIFRYSIAMPPFTCSVVPVT